MNYSVATCTRAMLITLLSLTLLGANSFAGAATGADVCAMPCCQPREHRTADEGEIRLFSAASATCCGGLNGYPCDLQTQPAPRQPYICHAIQSASFGGPAFTAAGQAVKITIGRTGFTGAPHNMTPVESRPIYIEIQSILI